MAGLLLDASVWLSALDTGDPFHEPSRALAGRGEGLAALDLTLYEVANVGLTKWHSPEWARVLVTLVLSASGRIITADERLLDQATRLAGRHGLTAYDAAYVAAAQAEGLTLVSADLRDLVRPGLAVAPDAAV